MSSYSFVVLHKEQVATGETIAFVSQERWNCGKHQVIWSPDWGKECVKEWKPLDEWITKLKGSVSQKRDEGVSRHVRIYSDRYWRPYPGPLSHEASPYSISNVLCLLPVFTHTDALCVQTNYLLYGVVLDVLQRIVLCSRCKMRLVPVFTREMHHQRTKTVCPSSSTWFIRRKHKDYHRVSCFPRDMLSA